MEDLLLTAKVHVNLERPNTLCGGAVDSLIESLEEELKISLQAVADRITEKFGSYTDGGSGKITVMVEIT